MSWRLQLSLMQFRSFGFVCLSSPFSPFLGNNRERKTGDRDVGLVGRDGSDFLGSSCQCLRGRPAPPPGFVGTGSHLQRPPFKASALKMKLTRNSSRNNESKKTALQTVSRHPVLQTFINLALKIDATVRSDKKKKSNR